MFIAAIFSPNHCLCVPTASCHHRRRRRVHEYYMCVIYRRSRISLLMLRCITWCCMALFTIYPAAFRILYSHNNLMIIFENLCIKNFTRKSKAKSSISSRGQERKRSKRYTRGADQSGVYAYIRVVLRISHSHNPRITRITHTHIHSLRLNGALNGLENDCRASTLRVCDSIYIYTPYIYNEHVYIYIY